MRKQFCKNKTLSRNIIQVRFSPNLRFNSCCGTLSYSLTHLIKLTNFRLLTHLRRSFSYFFCFCFFLYISIVYTQFGPLTQHPLSLQKHSCPRCTLYLGTHCVHDCVCVRTTLYSDDDNLFKICITSVLPRRRCCAHIETKDNISISITRPVNSEKTTRE